MVGLGALGLPIAVNLRRAGYRLQVHTRSRTAETTPELQNAEGIDLASNSSPAKAVLGCKALVLCVSDDAAVRNVLWGEHGAGPYLTEGSVVIDCSTIAPATAAAMATLTLMVNLTLGIKGSL